MFGGRVELQKHKTLSSQNIKHVFCRLFGLAKNGGGGGKIILTKFVTWKIFLFTVFSCVPVAAIATVHDVLPDTPCHCFRSSLIFGVLIVILEIACCFTYYILWVVPDCSFEKWQALSLVRFAPLYRSLVVVRKTKRALLLVPTLYGASSWERGGREYFFVYGSRCCVNIPSFESPVIPEWVNYYMPSVSGMCEEKMASSLGAGVQKEW